MDARVDLKSERSGLESLVDLYLTPRRRDDYETACPLATIASELPRANGETGTVASAGVDLFIATIQRLMDDSPPGEAKARATGIVAKMVGGMVLSPAGQVTGNVKPHSEGCPGVCFTLAARARPAVFQRSGNHAVRDRFCRRIFWWFYIARSVRQPPTTGLILAPWPVRIQEVV